MSLESIQRLSANVGKKEKSITLSKNRFKYTNTGFSGININL